MTGKTERALEDWTNHTKRQYKEYDREYSMDKTFNQPIKIFLEEEFDKYLNERTNEKILDIGSGLFPETYLPERDNTYCIDWLPPHIKNIENSYIGNAEALPFKNEEFGIVLLKQVYTYLINPKKCLEEMVRVLKPSGLFILMDWEGELRNESFMIQNFYPKEVAGQIELMGFEIVKSVRLLDRTKNTKGIYLTAIVANKKSEIF